jgi:predicted ATPase
MPIAARGKLVTKDEIPRRVGRDAELARVVALTAAHRLVPLAGLCGIGKTRLAIEVARHLRPRFSDKVWMAAR